MLRELLDPFREREDLKMDELVHVAADVIPRVADEPGYGRATAIPDARTVRYYIQQGLVDRPHGSAGPAALYGYRHLLQLVAVKVLQGQYMPMEKIREVIAGLENSELEERLDGWVATPREMWVQEPASWCARQLQSWITGGFKRVESRTGRSAQSASSKVTERQRAAALEYLRSLEGTGQEPPASRSRVPREKSPDAASRSGIPFETPVQASSQEPGQRSILSARRTARPPTSPAEEDQYGTADAELPGPEGASGPEQGWSRYELHPGIELHVRQGVRFPENPSFMSALASRLRAILAGIGRRRRPS